MKKSKTLIRSLQLTFLSTFIYFEFLEIAGISMSNKILFIFLGTIGLLFQIKNLKNLKFRFYSYFLLFLVFGFLTTLYSEHIATSLFQLLNWGTQMLFFTYLLCAFKGEDKLIKEMYRFIFEVIVFTSIIGIFEYFVPSLKRILKYVNNYDGFHDLNRVFSVYDNPNHFGIILSIGIIIGFYYLKTDFKIKTVIKLIALFVAILISKSRMALLIVLINLILNCSKKIKISLLIVFLFSIILLSILGRLNVGQKEISIILNNRYEIWSLALKLYCENNILFGIGMGNFQKISTNYFRTPYGMHSLFFALLVENGILGFLTFTLVVVNSWKASKFLNYNEKLLFRNLLILMLLSQLTEMYFANQITFIMIFWIVNATPLIYINSRKENHEKNIYSKLWRSTRQHNNNIIS